MNKSTAKKPREPVEYQSPKKQLTEFSDVLEELIEDVEYHDLKITDDWWMKVGMTNMKQGIMAVKEALGQPPVLRRIK